MLADMGNDTAVNPRLVFARLRGVYRWHLVRSLEPEGRVSCYCRSRVCGMTMESHEFVVLTVGAPPDNDEPVCEDCSANAIGEHAAALIELLNALPAIPVPAHATLEHLAELIPMAVG